MQKVLNWAPLVLATLITLAAIIVFERGGDKIDFPAAGGSVTDAITACDDSPVTLGTRFENTGDGSAEITFYICPDGNEVLASRAS